ncbi:MAG: hypothetical protein ABIH99_04640 [Candidatus Micrarchaeota archaeon]
MATTTLAKPTLVPVVPSSLVLSLRKPNKFQKLPLTEHALSTPRKKEIKNALKMFRSNSNEENKNARAKLVELKAYEAIPELMKLLELYLKNADAYETAVLYSKTPCAKITPFGCACAIHTLTDLNAGEALPLIIKIFCEIDILWTTIHDATARAVQQLASLKPTTAVLNLMRYPNKLIRKKARQAALKIGTETLLTELATSTPEMKERIAEYIGQRTTFQEERKFNVTKRLTCVLAAERNSDAILAIINAINKISLRAFSEES